MLSKTPSRTGPFLSHIIDFLLRPASLALHLDIWPHLHTDPLATCAYRLSVIYSSCITSYHDRVVDAVQPVGPSGYAGRVTYRKIWEYQAQLILHCSRFQGQYTAESGSRLHPVFPHGRASPRTWSIIAKVRRKQRSELCQGRSRISAPAR